MRAWPGADHLPAWCNNNNNTAAGMPDSGVCGSTSAGITLGAELANKTGWKAAILVSAPSMQATGPNSVGLHLYTSSDDHLLNWTQYIPTPLPSNGDPCVICPSIVPDWTHASNIGDTYVWSEPAWNVPSTNRTVFVLSGSSACAPDEEGGHWCGYARGKKQSLLFSSQDLVDWKFESVFWRGGSTASQRKTTAAVNQHTETCSDPNRLRGLTARALRLQHARRGKPTRLGSAPPLMITKHGPCRLLLRVTLLRVTLLPVTLLPV